ncbi:hypothetical protein PMAC_001891 [Pneumocystis sp. 'macacae']|nr:hypothetical protein PMAC_001891 [Pneumocystis sp. 'macacae']
MTTELCPVYAPFFGVLGCAAAIIFTSWYLLYFWNISIESSGKNVEIFLFYCFFGGFGAAYGTAKSGVGIASMGVFHPELIVKSTIPVVMAGIIAIYGLVVSVLISGGLKQHISLYTGFIQLGAGLAVGLSGLAAGFAIGIVGDAGVRGTAQQPRLYVGMILILIFSEVLGLYGLIVALLLNTRTTDAVCG